MAFLPQALVRCKLQVIHDSSLIASLVARLTAQQSLEGFVTKALPADNILLFAVSHDHNPSVSGHRRLAGVPEMRRHVR